MAVFRVTFPTWNVKAKDRFWAYCDFPAFDSMAEIMAALNAGQMVMGHKLWTKRAEDEQGECSNVVKTQPFAASTSGISLIDEVPESRRFVQFED